MNKLIIMVTAIMFSLNAMAADGLLSNTESNAKSLVEITINPEYRISGLEDIVFDKVDDQGNISAIYNSTKQTSFCVYANENYLISFELEHGASGMKNTSYEKALDYAPEDNIPVTYSLLKNQISEGSIQGLPLLVGTTFFDDYDSGVMLPNVEIMNPTCSSGEGIPLDNFILSAQVNVEDIIRASAGNYTSTVILRVSHFFSFPPPM